MQTFPSDLEIAEDDKLSRTGALRAAPTSTQEVGEGARSRGGG